MPAATGAFAPQFERYFPVVELPVVVNTIADDLAVDDFALNDLALDWGIHHHLVAECLQLAVPRWNDLSRPGPPTLHSR